MNKRVTIECLRPVQLSEPNINLQIFTHRSETLRLVRAQSKIVL